MNLIISHAHCPDGFCAAYIAKKRYPEAEILLLDHGIDPGPVLEQIRGKDVLMLDYSFRTRELNDEAAYIAKSFHIFDHHKSAQAVLEGAAYATFDMKRSGAGLAWDYLFGKDNFEIQEIPEDIPVKGNRYRAPARPWFVNYVEDRDLWNWKLPNSKEICAFISSHPFTIEAWDELQIHSTAQATLNGHWALKEIDCYVENVVQHARFGIFRGVTMGVLNIPYMHCSEAGHALAKIHGASLTWFERSDDMIQFSLRGDGKVDVSAIATTFGGGGHFSAAGFQLPLADGRRLIDQILGRNAPEPALDNANWEEPFQIPRSPGGCA